MDSKKYYTTVNKISECIDYTPNGSDGICMEFYTKDDNKKFFSILFDFIENKYNLMEFNNNIRNGENAELQITNNNSIVQIIYEDNIIIFNHCNDLNTIKNNWKIDSNIMFELNNSLVSSLKKLEYMK